MKIPDNYIAFKSFDEQQKKYRAWGFKTRKKNELKQLFYKGCFVENKESGADQCEIVGYSDCIPDEIVVVIKLLDSGTLIPIDRRYLKHMQNKDFRLDQDEEQTEEFSFGDELLELLDDYIVYDIETTGFNFRTEEIIEIAALKINKGTVIEEFQSFVHPTKKIPRIITKLTGITDAMLEHAYGVDDVLSEFKSFIGNSVLVGHNIGDFDNWFLSRDCMELNLGSFDNNYVDTLTIARKLYPELPSKKVEKLKEALNIELDMPLHRALNDCYYEYKIYEKMKHDIIEQYGNVRNFIYKASNKPRTRNNMVSQKNESSRYPQYINLKTISTSKTIFDTNHKLYDKSCVFTGELKKYSREEAAQLVVDAGGRCENNITKKTNYLIVSNDSDPNKKSGKQKKAEEYKSKGQDIEIISESVFYDMINED